MVAMNEKPNSINLYFILVIQREVRNGTKQRTKLSEKFLVKRIIVIEMVTVNVVFFFNAKSKLRKL